MEREKRKEEIEKDYLKVKRYLIEDEKPPKYTSVIKNIELYLKSIKSQQSTFIEYIYIKDIANFLLFITIPIIYLTHHICIMFRNAGKLQQWRDIIMNKVSCK